jgi:hypothetical protein
MVPPPDAVELKLLDLLQDEFPRPYEPSLPGRLS